MTVHEEVGVGALRPANLTIIFDEMVGWAFWVINLPEPCELSTSVVGVKDLVGGVGLDPRRRRSLSGRRLLIGDMVEMLWAISKGIAAGSLFRPAYLQLLCCDVLPFSS